jgi:hypothetical protein
MRLNEVQNRPGNTRSTSQIPMRPQRLRQSNQIKAVDTARRKAGQARLIMRMSAEPKKEIKITETKHHNNRRIIPKNNSKEKTKSAIGMKPLLQKYSSLWKTTRKRRDGG